MRQFRQNPGTKTQRLLRRYAPLHLDQNLQISHQLLSLVLVLQGLDKLFKGFGRCDRWHSQILSSRRDRWQKNKGN